MRGLRAPLRASAGPLPHRVIHHVRRLEVEMPVRVHVDWLILVSPRFAAHIIVHLEIWHREGIETYGNFK